jgi:CheY-like chemotaxis protein
MDTLGPISERRELVASLIARICDEMRLPVETTLASCERLRHLRLPPEAAGDLDAITEAAAGVSSLLSTALQLQRAELGQLVLTPEPRLLGELMDQLEARWRDRAQAVGVCLMVAYDGTRPCAALVDGQRLEQVFDALIGHALDHVRGGVVEAILKTRSDGDAVRVECAVRDSAALYTAQYLDGLFGAGLADVESGGMAVMLDLALAGRIVEAMGGRLAANANVGAGATMSFNLELRAAALPGAGDAVAANAKTRSAHVLVVDDNATNRMVVEALCEMFDCSTEAVVDGVEAVEAARVGRFDIILMDIKMPRMDGLTATREIRKLKGAAGRPPIIALTANADEDDVRQYLAAGMVGVVEKPIKPERLLEALDAALSAAPRHIGAAAAA